MIPKNQKNKLKTAGYFIKRLKDAGYVVLRMFHKYSDKDSRKWTILVDPSGASIYITCFEDRPFRGEYLFSFEDGNQLFARGYVLKTSSIDVVIERLNDRNILHVDDNDFVTKYKKHE
jgi:hypothetical protein|tara:strand:- start:233 stop:586 length:354 start_codon:yes stop_codon:yes gene_type:complete